MHAVAARLGRVHVNVRDAARAARFYTGLLGLRVRHDTRDAVFLSAGGSGWDLALHASAGAADPPTALGCRSIGFEVGGPEELAEIHAALTRRAAPVMAVDHGATWSIHTEDPDGNIVEIYCAAPASIATDSRWGHGRVLEAADFDAVRGLSVS
jgi:catechol-2,3-dioxygenase